MVAYRRFPGNPVVEETQSPTSNARATREPVVFFLHCRSQNYFLRLAPSSRDKLPENIDDDPLFYRVVIAKRNLRCAFLICASQEKLVTRKSRLRKIPTMLKYAQQSEEFLR